MDFKRVTEDSMVSQMILFLVGNDMSGLMAGLCSGSTTIARNCVGLFVILLGKCEFLGPTIVSKSFNRSCSCVSCRKVEYEISVSLLRRDPF